MSEDAMVVPSADPDLLKGLAEEAWKVGGFFSNESKKDRENWVLLRWADCAGQSLEGVQEGEGPDFTVAGLGIEIVEVQQPGRRRGDECKADTEALAQGKSPEWRNWVDLQLVQDEAHRWIVDAITKKAKRYGRAARTWVLVVYANYGWWEETNWAAVREVAEELVDSFDRIDVLGASGETVVRIKP
jgi:hypothetical protein